MRVFNISVQVEVQEDCDSWFSEAEVEVEVEESIRQSVPEGVEVLEVSVNEQ